MVCRRPRVWNVGEEAGLATVRFEGVPKEEGDGRERRVRRRACWSSRLRNPWMLLLLERLPWRARAKKKEGSGFHASVSGWVIVVVRRVEVKARLRTVPCSPGADGRGSSRGTVAEKRERSTLKLHQDRRHFLLAATVA
ncbi:hypothetical protein MLD38_005625 [Melastoma candidum]|uniref:Uncharacterized protein n=1 Tax=Melastoma candidum TaxID=119954 RepID=A0ACB9RNX4_9MYRT|nr:hypothetical protein MLD38_005625 [Melastoma candidum]